jgi:hypothetical protein
MLISFIRIREHGHHFQCQIKTFLNGPQLIPVAEKGSVLVLDIRPHAHHVHIHIPHEKQVVGQVACILEG